jgi:quinoprotein glucose dehydrogenase
VSRSVVTALSLLIPAGFLSAQTSVWPAYGGDPGGHRFADLSQITPRNVGDLRLVWEYRTGDLLEGRGRFEATPILVDGTLYLSTPLATVVALDPASGAERWVYDPQVDLRGDYGDFANRGVAAWLDASAAAGTPCRRRIFVATVDARLIALDGTNGRPCDDFGAHGTVDLTRALSNPPAYASEYAVTSPPTVVGSVVIVGSAVADNHRIDAPNGVVRAYDVRTGTERWSWDPVPRLPGAPGYDTWSGEFAHVTGAANAWTILSADTARDLVFVPTGSAAPDFYGGDRLGQDLYANSVVALRASTGAMVWHFQVVHHDLWDYDVPAQPVAFTWHRAGREIPALAVATKMGHLFILDRTTGQPLVPVAERPVPASDIAGEQAWPTQPFPPPAYRFVPESLSAADAFGLTPERREQCRARIAALRSDGIFTPSSLRGSVHYPGHIGGFNWSGVSVDERGGVLVAPVNRLAMAVTLVPRDSIRAARRAHPDAEFGSMRGTPYGMLRETLLGLDHVPCTPPPWGELVAFDLTQGRVRWRMPLGEWPGTASVPGHTAFGSISLGGVLVTAGGLVFAAGTLDQQLRAFDLATGRVLWSAPLPAGGHALPMSYRAAGRQYVVIAAGGHDRLGTKLGDYVLAYALPEAGAPAPDTTAPDPAGDWAGELRVNDHDRHPTTLRLHTVADSISGDMTSDAGAIGGTVSGRLQGRQLALAIAFTSQAGHCAGTIQATGEAANHGRLLVGTLHIESTCSDGPEHGTFSFRRAAR